jgi:alkyl sulfatase BDS1-like metallo-beta-lactamase superfamily hydrolase
VANIIFIVGKDGLVVCDTTESLPAAKRVFEDFKRAVPQAAALPVRAAIYAHNYMDHIAGVRAFATDEELASGEIKIIAHESLLSILVNNANLVGPILALRALYSFGNLIEHGPKGHVNCGVGPALLREGASFIAPSVTFAERLDITLAASAWNSVTPRPRPTNRECRRCFRRSSPVSIRRAPNCRN